MSEVDLYGGLTVFRRESGEGEEKVNEICEG